MNATSVGRGLARAALPWLCAVSAAAQAASAGPPPPPTPSEGPIYTGMGRFESRLVIVQDDLLVRLYEQALRIRFPKAEDAGIVRQLLETPAAHGDQAAYGRAEFQTGEYAGGWQFLSPDGGPPTRAWRDIDRSGEQGFDAERIGYCRGDVGDCERWFAEGRHRTPRPRPEVAERAQVEWKNRAMQEACTPMPAYRPNLAPVQSAVGRAALPSTRVELLVLLNPCGEVRDAMFRTSSGHRDVDRALLSWARRAVLPQDAQGSKVEGGYGLLPFELQAEPLPETPPASP
ncbi:MAG: hypothetical protein ACOY82_07335 [Pseudomonadota bacterium]